ncbi:MAG: DNA polymerase IV [Lachnospiraceae bacterium]|nr:DNA polymerase IV [Lachnospiraceae bacterium]
MERVIFHIDVNNAYLSWEALYRLNELGETLDLRTIPSAIGGNKESRHGIILAKSMPARGFGVKTAETLGDARKKCPNLMIVPPRMHIYKEYSRKLIALLHEYSPIIEQYSIDEAFADMTGFGKEIQTRPVAVAEELRQHVYDTLGFTVNIGVSSNKILAKMASDFEKPNRVHSLFPKEIQKKMWPLPVDTLFFVGRATKNRLYNLGIRTIGELALFDRDILRSHLGKHGTLIHDYANGIDTSPVAAEATDNKGYGNSTTISHDVTDSAEAKKYLLSLCESVGSRLRKDHVLAGVVSVSIKDFRFSRGSHQCTLDSPTNVTSELYAHACELFDEYWDGSPIRLIGVSTSKITRESMRQLNLFEQDKYIKQGKLENAIDTIREKFGENAIMRASFLEAKENQEK